MADVNFKIQDGIIEYDTNFDGTHTVDANRNALLAGPITLSGTLNVGGHLLVTSEINITGTVNITGSGSLTVN